MEEEQEQKRNGKRTEQENSQQGAKIHTVQKLALVPILALDFGVGANFGIRFWRWCQFWHWILAALDFGVGANFGTLPTSCTKSPLLPC